MKLTLTMSLVLLIVFLVYKLKNYTKLYVIPNVKPQKIKNCTKVKTNTRIVLSDDKYIDDEATQQIDQSNITHSYIENDILSGKTQLNSIQQEEMDISVIIPYIYGKEIDVRKGLEVLSPV